ncbi:MAG: hypothetical protein WBK91_04005 [Alphaproteobacteria bacterium]
MYSEPSSTYIIILSTMQICAAIILFGLVHGLLVRRLLNLAVPAAELMAETGKKLLQEQRFSTQEQTIARTLLNSPIDSGMMWKAAFLFFPHMLFEKLFGKKPVICKACDMSGDFKKFIFMQIVVSAAAAPIPAVLFILQAVVVVLFVVPTRFFMKYFFVEYIKLSGKKICDLFHKNHA